jgi:hypothetical protein
VQQITWVSGWASGAGSQSGLPLELISTRGDREAREPETGTRNIPIFSPPLSAVVTGAGRLKFYWAPNANCAMAGVFVIPTDELINLRPVERWLEKSLHADYFPNLLVAFPDGFVQPARALELLKPSGPALGFPASSASTGGVRSSRLKTTGTVGH